MNELALMGGALSFDNVLDRLLNECEERHKQAQLLLNHTQQDGFSDLWRHVQTANSRKGNHIPSASNVFGGVSKAIDAFYWGEVIRETKVLDYVKNAIRSDWQAATTNHDTPPFTRENVLSTLLPMFKDLPKLFAERLHDTFRKLSSEHYTNNSSGFNKRMIFTVAYPRPYFFNLSHDMCGYVNDLRSVISQITGGNQLEHGDTYRFLNRMERLQEFGEWIKLDEYVAIKLFKKGTCHVEVEPEMAEMLNNILASTFSNEVPDLSRERVEKAKQNAKANKNKFHDKAFTLIDVATAEVCKGVVIPSQGMFKIETRGKSSDMLKSVMYHLDGAFKDGCYWFDYNPKEVLKFLVNVGKLPDYKSFQYYPTPKDFVHAIKSHYLDMLVTPINVLEPSAGTGNLVDWIDDRSIVDCYDVSELQCKVLEAKGYKTHNADFMLIEPIANYDLIVMNPPYNNNQCYEHIKHAEKFLDNDGIIYAVVPSGHKHKYVSDGYKLVAELPRGFKHTSIETVVMFKVKV